MAASQLLPGLSVGFIFTALGVLKFTGLHLGIRGGRGVPLPRRMVGTCPTWTSKWLRFGMPALFLATGLLALGLTLARYLSTPP